MQLASVHVVSFKLVVAESALVVAEESGSPGAWLIGHSSTCK